jgi:hypothetical protein
VRLIALALALAAAPVSAQMYKCVDAKGVTRYVDSPGPGCKEVAIRGSPPISGAIQPPSEDLARQEAAFRRRQLEREQGAERDRAALAQRCIQMRREHAALSNARRVVRFNEKGEREYLDDGLRERRVAELQREIARCP